MVGYVKRSCIKTELMKSNEVEPTANEINNESQIELLQEKILVEKSLREDLEKHVVSLDAEIKSLQFQLRRARQVGTGRV